MGTSPEESGDSGCVFHVRHRSWKSNAIKIHRPPNSENWSRQGGTMCVYMYVPTYRRHHCGQVRDQRDPWDRQEAATPRSHPSPTA